MDRLQKKCVVASLGTHGLLLLLVVFGTGWFRPRKASVDIPAIRVVPGTLVDALISGGGGDPKVAPSNEKLKGETLLEQPAPAPPPKSVTQPAKQQSPPVQPPKLALVPTTRSTPSKNPREKAPNLKLTPVKAGPSTKSNPQSTTSQASKELATKIGDSVAALRSGFEQGTAVEISGTGEAAFVNYAQWVKQVYEDAWFVNDEVEDDESTAKVSVTIARNGEVVDAHITRKSGNAALDASVQRTLAKVRRIRPFPEGSKDNERTFIINFNLKAKRAIG